MQTAIHGTRRGDGHLWMIAFGASLAANGVIVLLVGLMVIRSTVINKSLLAPQIPQPEESVVMVFPELAKIQPAAALPAEKKRMVRTSPDQAAPVEPRDAAFIGERNTEATSDRRPDAAAPPLPSQKGIRAENGEIETTESRYRDGRLTGGTPDTRPAPPEPAPPEKTAVADQPEAPDAGGERSLPPQREKLLDGPNPVDVPVPLETARDDTIKPTPETRPRPDEVPPKPRETAKPVETPKPKPSPEPEFRGFQRKTALVGSINRTGRSALDVEDSALGRYGMAISRAVELEFQRNCVRHRDYITPGFLTVRFYIEPSGKVRSVHLDGDMSTGEIQKGFTLNSIRDAEIPAMPKALGREYAKEPLEMVFRFYF